MELKFDELGLKPSILKAIKELGFENPTPVQSKTIPTIIKRKDAIVMSKTGSGKTAVFGLPMLQMIENKSSTPKGLILTPTRELAVQVQKDISQMAKYTDHKVASVYGQHNINAEIKELREGVDILCGTPGRVYDHLNERNFNPKDIEFLVLDEADRMLDMGFLPQVIRIIKTLPRNRITLLFSATVPPEVKRISQNFMNSPEIIEVESETMTVDLIDQIYYKVEKRDKKNYLNKVLLWERPKNCLIFCNTKIEVDKVCIFLNRKGYAALPLHGDIPQAKRLKTIDDFKSGKFSILVATDVAARGIHVESLSLVINYDVPLEKDSYVHRIGRTGRAGNFGLAISIVTSEDVMNLYAIEEHTGALIEPVNLIADEDLEEEKEMVDEWIKANSINSIKSPARPKQQNKTSNKTNINNTKKTTFKSASPKIKKPEVNKPEVNKSERKISIDNKQNSKFKLRTTIDPDRKPQKKAQVTPVKAEKERTNPIKKIIKTLLKNK